jgi:hypothetical protein
LPFGIPGIADEIDGAMQQAPQPRRQAGTAVGCNATDIPPFYRQMAGNPGALGNMVCRLSALTLTGRRDTLLTRK